jgi:hypothetical protein
MFHEGGLHFCQISHLSRSRNSSVGIASSYGLDDGEIGVRVPVG